MTLILVAVNESEREEKEREGERKERTVCFAAGKKKEKIGPYRRHLSAFGFSVCTDCTCTLALVAPYYYY